MRFNLIIFWVEIVPYIGDRIDIIKLIEIVNKTEVVSVSKKYVSLLHASVIYMIDIVLNELWF